jgi:predicted YcjX-like family ATPase
MRDLENALAHVLTAFRAGRTNLLTTIFRPRIDKILFAATKADHLHHTSHDRLEAILRHLVGRAIARAENVGAAVDVVAMAAMRATREAAVQPGRKRSGDRETVDAIIGTPLAGEEIAGDVFDGTTDVAIFPGELPADSRAVFRGETLAIAPGEADYRFVRFRPPVAELATDRLPLPLPHIRLDRALEFLIGDKVR